MGREPSAGTTGSRRTVEESAGVDSRAGPAGFAGSSSADSGAGTERYDDSHGVGSGPQGVGLESVGLVAGEGDAGRLIAEAESAAAGGVDSGVGSAPAPGGSWSALTPGLVTVTCGIVLPQWQVPANEQIEVAAALGECMEQLFPGGIEGRYACWVRLVFACGAVSISAVNRHGGRLPPLFMKPAKPPPSTSSSAPIAPDTAPLDFSSAPAS